MRKCGSAIREPPWSSLGVHTVGSRDWKENKSFTIFVINPSPSIQRQRDWFAVCLLGLGFVLSTIGAGNLSPTPCY